ncbi:MAG: LptF/LptG family permease [Anaeromyxobacteraceae bacterium]
MRSAPVERPGLAPGAARGPGLRVTALDRYLAREILAPFAAGLLFLTQILLATQILAQADVLLGSGVSALDVGRVALDLVPHFLGYVLPVAFLLGAVVGVGRLAEDRELVALGAAGVSPSRLLRVPVALGAGVAVIALWLALAVEPAALRDARLRVNDLIRKNVTSEVRSGVFYEDLPGLTLYAERTQGGRWTHVLISDRTDPSAPLLALAQAGRLEPAGEGEEMRLVLDRGELHREELRAEEYVAARYDRATITLGIGETLSERNRLVGSPFELGPAEIVQNARAAREPDGKRRWWTFLHRRIAGPLSIVAFGLLATPIAAWRRGGRASGYAVTLLAVVAYYAVLRFGEGLAQRGAVAPWLGANLANLAFAVVGAGLGALVARRGAGAVR